MRIQDQMVKLTQNALDDVCQAALETPRSNWDRSPLKGGPTMLSHLRKVALGPDVLMPVLRFRSAEIGVSDSCGLSPEDLARLADVPKCVEVARRSYSLICQEIGAFPDTQLDQEVTSGPEGGERLTMADVLAIPYWTLVYHLGQINQIQLLLDHRGH